MVKNYQYAIMSLQMLPLSVTRKPTKRLVNSLYEETMADSNRNMTSLVLCFIIVAIAGGALVTRCTGYVPPVVVRSDTVTVVVRDTMVVEKPTEICRYIVRHDTIRTNDIVIITDTATNEPQAIIPIEQAVYSDSTEKAKYTAYVSGYRAALDSIQIECISTQTTITNTERIKPSRFGVGVQLGVGVSPQGLAVPYLGVGVQYRLWPNR